jgi:hypothetical protein
LHQAWRSPWFRNSGTKGSSAIFRYERDAAFRLDALARVHLLLSRPDEPPIATSAMDPETAMGLLLACHERNSGASGARFLPGGRQVLVRGLPVLLNLLPTPQIVEQPSSFIEAAHRRSPAPLLLDLATGVFQRDGATAVADVVICVMRWHGLRYFNRWGFHRELTDYKRELLAALASRDLPQLGELTANWKLPPRALVADEVTA